MKVILSVLASIPLTVAVTTAAPAASDDNLVVAPPAAPVLPDSLLKVPAVVFQETVAPLTGLPSFVRVREIVALSVPSAVTDVLSADSVTPPRQPPVV